MEGPGTKGVEEPQPPTDDRLDGTASLIQGDGPENTATDALHHGFLGRARAIVLQVCLAFHLCFKRVNSGFFPYFVRITEKVHRWRDE